MMSQSHKTRAMLMAFGLSGCLVLASACSPPAVSKTNNDNNTNNTNNQNNTNNKNNTNNQNNQNNTNNTNNKNNQNNTCPTPVGECGNCDQDCIQTGVGPSQGGDPFVVGGENDQGVKVNEKGEITLQIDEVSANDKIIWVANTGQGTVAKIDTTTYMETARYYTGPSGMGNDPSRTSVNGFGDVYIGNRTAGGATKIKRDCKDVDGNGTIDTSTGASDLKDWGKDECVAWHKPLCQGCLIRAVAAQDIAPNGEIKPVVWVGGFESSTIWKLDGETGDILLETASPVRPYGFALDKEGNLWISGPNWSHATEQRYFGRIDTTRCIDDMSCAAAPCDGEAGDACVKQRIPVNFQPYGITVDYKQRVWLGGEKVMRYDPSKPMGQRTAETTVGFIHGIAADDKGWVFGSNEGSGVVQINAEDLTQTKVVPGSGSSKGIAVDKDGKVWSISRQNSSAVVIQPGQTINDSTVVSTINGFIAPYTYSDMTGQQLSLASDVAGFFRVNYEECSRKEFYETNWQEVIWDVETPTDTTVTIRIRAAQSLTGLAAKDWDTIATLPGQGASPFDLAGYLQGKNLAKARHVQVEVLMNAKRTPGVMPQAPILKGLAVTKSCPPIIN